MQCVCMCVHSAIDESSPRSQSRKEMWLTGEKYDCMTDWRLEADLGQKNDWQWLAASMTGGGDFASAFSATSKPKIMGGRCPFSFPSLPLPPIPSLPFPFPPSPLPSGPFPWPPLSSPPVLSPRLWNDLYCVEWDVKLYYTIPSSPLPTILSPPLRSRPLKSS